MFHVWKYMYLVICRVSSFSETKFMVMDLVFTFFKRLFENSYFFCGHHKQTERWAQPTKGEVKQMTTLKMSVLMIIYYD